MNESFQLHHFLYPQKNFSGGGLKTETGNFLLHFQNSKSNNRCRSVYGTDLKKIFNYVMHSRRGLGNEVWLICYAVLAANCRTKNFLEKLFHGALFDCRIFNHFCI